MKWPFKYKKNPSLTYNCCHAWGYFDKERERAVIEAIRKSECNKILVGLGIPKQTKG
jgi:UDP-N-acetyl-D-mannosaminuronic acid transferase (WecB/TagA/CpsF family)